MAGVVLPSPSAIHSCSKRAAGPASEIACSLMPILVRSLLELRKLVRPHPPAPLQNRGIFILESMNYNSYAKE